MGSDDASDYAGDCGGTGGGDNNGSGNYVDERDGGGTFSNRII